MDKFISTIYLVAYASSLHSDKTMCSRPILRIVLSENWLVLFLINCRDFDSLFLFAVVLAQALHEKHFPMSETIQYTAPQVTHRLLEPDV